MANDEPMGIMEFEENLADVEKPPEIAAGRYVGEVQGVEEKISTAGNAYFAVQFKIPPDELPPDLAEHYEDGASLYWNRVVKPKGRADRRALFNLRRFVEALGLDSNTNAIDPNEWMGQRAKLHVAMGKWQGEDRAEIRSVEAADAAPPRQAAAAPAGRGRAATGGGRRGRAAAE